MPFFGYLFGRVSGRFIGQIDAAQRGGRVHVCGRLNSEAEQADAVLLSPSHVDQKVGKRQSSADQSDHRKCERLTMMLACERTDTCTAEGATFKQ
jgi:hypothetical protein